MAITNLPFNFSETENDHSIFPITFHIYISLKVFYNCLISRFCFRTEAVHQLSFFVD